MQKTDWHGVIPAITTPLHEDLTIDHEFLANHVKMMVDAGCTAIVTPGSLGEAGTLSLREKEAIYQAKIFLVGNVPRLWIETITVAAFICGLIYIIQQSTSIEGLLSTLALIGAAAFRLVPSVNRIVGGMNKIRNGSYPVDKIFEDLETFKVVEAATKNRNKKLNFNKELTLEDVSFTYPESTQPVISNINLTVSKGESIGIVGPSGAGKTTLVDIILGLLQPGSGHITVDKLNIADHIPEWQKNLSYVPQLIYLNDDTFKHNIVFGRHVDEIDEKKLLQAVSLAGLDELVNSLPKGLDTLVGDRGIRISGGQRQRLGIARALYHEPELLVLDEATSSLDGESEHAINVAKGL